MGRSSRSQAEQNRARIVDVATDLFREHGVAAVSIADIMTAAGMTQGGFYTHFPSKEALAAEACTTAFLQSVESWKKKARRAEDGGSALRELVAYYFAPKPPEWTCPMVALGQDAAAQSPDHPLHEAYSDGVKRLLEAFSEVAEANEKPSMPREQVIMLFTAMVGANLLARAVGNKPWIAEMKELVLGSVDGIGVR